MIRVRVCKENNKIKAIYFTGHALSDDYGKDIVCAASSATVLTTINGILSIDENAINVKQNGSNIDVLVVSSDDIILKLIDNMLVSLKSIENDYPKNIKLIEEE